jgi:arylsulfatase A
MPEVAAHAGREATGFAGRLLHGITPLVPILCGAALSIGPANSTSLGAEGRAPNIVLIMADDMGYECVGANGGTSYRTPNLDRLASGGLRFEHGYSQPLCTPSRVQIMTGIYNQKNYVRFGILAPDQTTFAHLLKKAGYATCVAGKWQLLGGFDGPQHFGFDEYCLWQLTRRPGR